jgi:hypothetical protein
LALRLIDRGCEDQREFADATTIHTVGDEPLPRPRADPDMSI